MILNLRLIVFFLNAVFKLCMWPVDNRLSLNLQDGLYFMYQKVNVSLNREQIVP